MKKVSDIFYVYTGSKLDFGKQQMDKDGINFVSRNSNNNGVVGRILLEDDMVTYKKGDISVPLGGSFLLSCFVQEEDFVTAQNVHVLRSKNPKMTDQEKWFYCYALRLNRFKFIAFGREVNKYLKDILVPEFVPEWVNKAKLSMYEFSNKEPSDILLDISQWGRFECEKLFDVTRGELVCLNDLLEGDTPVVSAFGNFQGIQYYLDVDAPYSNTLTVSFNGSGTGYCAYHEYSFNANSDCGVLIPKFKMNKYIGLFLATCINYFSYKYMYGRKMTNDRILKEVLVLPIDNFGNPDWTFMENYIKSLSYSNKI